MRMYIFIVILLFVNYHNNFIFFHLLYILPLEQKFLAVLTNERRSMYIYQKTKQSFCDHYQTRSETLGKVNLSETVTKKLGYHEKYK